MTTQTIQEQHSKDLSGDLEYYFRLHSHRVINGLSDGRAHRFNELKRRIREISSNTLSSILTRLVSDGIVNRLVIPTVPPSVEYSLTQKGMDLLDVFAHASEWSAHWHEVRN